MAEVLHPTAEPDGNLRVDAAALNVGFGDEPGAGQYFRSAKEKRERKGPSRNTC